MLLMAAIDPWNRIKEAIHSFYCSSNDKMCENKKNEWNLRQDQFKDCDVNLNIKK